MWLFEENYEKIFNDSESTEFTIMKFNENDLLELRIAVWISTFFLFVAAVIFLLLFAIYCMAIIKGGDDEIEFNENSDLNLKLFLGTGINLFIAILIFTSGLSSLSYQDRLSQEKLAWAVLFSSIGRIMKKTKW